MPEEGSFSIRIVDEDGDPLAGVEISCAYGLTSGVGTQHTDGDGWAEFPIITKVLGGGAIEIRKVWVDGEEVGHAFTPEDGDTFSFSI